MLNRAANLGPLFALLLGSVIALFGQGPVASVTVVATSSAPMVALFDFAEGPQLTLDDVGQAHDAAEVREGEGEGEGEGGGRRGEAVDDGTTHLLGPAVPRSTLLWQLEMLAVGELDGGSVDLPAPARPVLRRFAHAPAPARAPPHGSLTA